MNVFKYIWLKLIGYFVKPTKKYETYEEYQERISEYANQTIYKNRAKERAEEAKAKFPLDLPPKEKDPARWEINEEKPKRPYNRATKQQVARIKVLVGRGKTAKQIAKDVGLPYDNVNYYVKKFGG